MLATPFLTSLVARAGDRFTIWSVAVAATAIYCVISLSDGSGSCDTLPTSVKQIYLFITIGGTILLASGISLFFRWLIERAEAELQAENKTIGDTYLSVNGLPDAKPDHAARVADFAFGLQAATDELAKLAWPDLQLPIVIHTGPVVAGVIGRSKFAYDIWGDTVNTAARLKDIYAPREIVLTEATRAALPSRHQLEAKGTVSLRDKGSLLAYRLIHRNVKA